VPNPRLKPETPEYKLVVYQHKLLLSPECVLFLDLFDPEDGGSKPMYRFTRHNNPEDLNLQQCHCENLKSHNVHHITTRLPPLFCSPAPFLSLIILSFACPSTYSSISPSGPLMSDTLTTLTSMHYVCLQHSTLDVNNL
jgi:hypothetical protein